MLRRLTALDARERRLLVVGLCWVIASRAALVASAGSLQGTQKALDVLGRRLPRPRSFTLQEAAWATSAAARRVPGTRCLAWALALRGLLSHAGIPSQLRIGVAKAEPGRLTAHAWIDCAGRTLSWGDSVERYNVLHPSAARS